MMFPILLCDAYRYDEGKMAEKDNVVVYGG